MSFTKLLFRFSNKIKSLDALPNDLLVTLSMHHQTQSFKSLPSLLSHLKSANILKTPLVEEVILSLPREKFIPSAIKVPHSSVLQIKPLKIGCGQTMTDLAVQTQCLEALYPEIQKMDTQFRILDIGSGSGYMSFALCSIAHRLKGPLFNGLKGIDIYQELVDHTNRLLGEIGNGVEAFKSLEFESVGLLEFLTRKNQVFDLINFGFSIDRPQLKTVRESLLRDPIQGVVLCPISESKDSAQKLTLISNGTEHMIMETFFSDIVDKGLKDSYKFFVDDTEGPNHKEAAFQERVDESKEDEERFCREKRVLEEMEKDFKNMVTELKRQTGKKNLSAKELLSEPAVKAKLTEIKDFRRRLK